MAAPASSGYDRGCSICSRNKRLHHHHHRCRLNRNCRERLLLSLLLLFFHPSFPFLHSSFILSCPRDSFLSFVLSSFNPCPYFFFLIPSSFPFLLPSFLLPWVLLFPFLHDFVPSILLFFYAIHPSSEQSYPISTTVKGDRGIYTPFDNDALSNGVSNRGDFLPKRSRLFQYLVPNESEHFWIYCGIF